MTALAAQTKRIVQPATNRADVTDTVGIATGIAAIRQLRIGSHLVVGKVNFAVVIADDIESIKIRHTAFVPFELRNTDAQIKIEACTTGKGFVLFCDVNFPQGYEVFGAGVTVFLFAQVYILFCPTHHHRVDEIVATIDAFYHRKQVLVLRCFDVFPYNTSAVDKSVVPFGNEHLGTCKIVVEVCRTLGGLFVTHATVMQSATHVRVLTDVRVVLCIVCLLHALLAADQFEMNLGGATDGTHEIGDVVAVVIRQPELLGEVQCRYLATVMLEPLSVLSAQIGEVRILKVFVATGNFNLIDPYTTIVTRCAFPHRSEIVGMDIGFLAFGYCFQYIFGYYATIGGGCSETLFQVVVNH